MTLRDLLPALGHKPDRRVHAGVALAGLAAGATAVALLEPGAGARRRGLVVQKTVHAGKSARSFGEKAARDLANRSRGLLASARSSVRETEVEDDVLRERVRSRIGRLTSHPSAIDVSVLAHVVELRGPILDAEAEGVVEGVRRVRGVHEVVDRLGRHADAEHVPGLQGGPRRGRSVPEVLQRRWTPGTRLLAILFGAGLVATGVRVRRPASPVIAALGALLALRGAANLPVERLVGVCLGAGRRAPPLRELRRS